MTRLEMALIFMLILSYIMLGSTYADYQNASQSSSMYQYATEYLVDDYQNIKNEQLEYCIDGMNEAIEKGFIQEQPPKLVMPGA